MAATYSEPTVFFELALETGKLAKEAGMVNTWVSNGCTSEAARELLVPHLDAINVDLKAFDSNTYKRVCGGHLETVLEAIAHYKRAGVWVEVTTLVIPGLNDSSSELRQIASYIASLDSAIPWHVSAFRPCYKMLDRSATPPETLERAVKIGQQVGLHYVYTGNLWDGHHNTSCPSCNKVVVHRQAMRLSRIEIERGKCPDCGRQIEGLWTG